MRPRNGGNSNDNLTLSAPYSILLLFAEYLGFNRGTCRLVLPMQVACQLHTYCVEHDLLQSPRSPQAYGQHSSAILVLGSTGHCEETDKCLLP